MKRVRSLYRTSVGKKAVMAVSGAIFVLFVLAHMLGNMKVYLGPEAFNHYAEGLREVGDPFLGYGWGLWIARGLLVLALVLHVHSAYRLSLMSWSARGSVTSRYRREQHLELHYASRTMRWGGVVLFLFVTYHILHLTTGTLHPDFVPGDAYHNFVAGFRAPPVSIAYMAAMLALGFHLYHGTWSAFHTLGWEGSGGDRVRRTIALGIAGVVVLGNLSFPVAVLTGLVR